jgi:hypothetical protein
MKLFRIKPLEKKSIEQILDVYESMIDGTIRGFAIRETYRWGQGFREEDNPVYDSDLNGGLYCDPNIGDGAELDDLCSVDFEFDDQYSSDEQAEIEAQWEDGGCSWLFDGEHNYQVEDHAIIIYGPVSIEFVDNDGQVITENVVPKKFEANTSWPFSTEFPKDPE